MISQMILGDIKSVLCRTIHMKTGELSFLLEPKESDADVMELSNLICYVYTLANAKKIENIIYFKLSMAQFKELYPLFKTLSFQYYKKKRKIGVLINISLNEKANVHEINEVSKTLKSLALFKLKVMLSAPLQEGLLPALKIHHDYFLLNVESGTVQSESILKALKKENLIFWSSNFIASQLNLSVEGSVSIKD